MLRKTGMTSSSSCIDGVPEKPACCNCNFTKLLILLLFVLYAVCQVQIFVNRERSVDVGNILSGIQQASERIADMELSLVKVESSLEFLEAEWAKKTTHHTRTKRQSASSIRQEMRQIKRYLKHLERRVQCATSDNGTDGRGKPCPARGGGKTGFLKEKRKGEKSDSTGNPTPKSKKKQNGATTPSQTSSQTGSRTTKRRQSTVYTYWGSGKCPNSDGVRTVYSGKVASLYSRSKALVGSEFLCIPKRVEYTDFKNMTSGLYLSPVKYGVNMSIFRKIGPEQCKSWGPKCDEFKKTKPKLFKNLDFFQVPCAVCLRERRTATLVTPGRNMCHSGWWKEYIGYLMTNHHGDSAQHICVGADSDGVPGSNSTETRGPLLQPVAYKCNGPGCPTNLDISNKKVRALTCVVCTI